MSHQKQIGGQLLNSIHRVISNMRQDKDLKPENFEDLYQESANREDPVKEIVMRYAIYELLRERSLLQVLNVESEQAKRIEEHNAFTFIDRLLTLLYSMCDHYLDNININSNTDLSMFFNFYEDLIETSTSEHREKMVVAYYKLKEKYSYKKRGEVYMFKTLKGYPDIPKPNKRTMADKPLTGEDIDLCDDTYRVKRTVESKPMPSDDLVLIDDNYRVLRLSSEIKPKKNSPICLPPMVMYGNLELNQKTAHDDYLYMKKTIKNKKEKKDKNLNYGDCKYITEVISNELAGDHNNMKETDTLKINDSSLITKILGIMVEMCKQNIVETSVRRETKCCGRTVRIENWFVKWSFFKYKIKGY